MAKNSKINWIKVTKMMIGKINVEYVFIRNNIKKSEMCGF